MTRKKYYHVPTGKYYHTNGASGLVNEHSDTPIPLWLAENSKDWVSVSNDDKGKKIKIEITASVVTEVELQEGETAENFNRDVDIYLHGARPLGYHNKVDLGANEVSFKILSE